MAVVNMPKPQAGPNSSSLLSIAGAVGGGIVGGPAGASLGMGLGNAVGGMQAQPQQAPQAIDSNALSRRQAQMDSTPILQIQDSLNALREIQDPQQRAELAKPLLQADYMARNGKAGPYGG